jgi:50S ribosomal protein L16 3-hydroxylase
MASLPIEVRAGRNLPLGMPPARFLRDYWQKRPLLIRGGFADFQNCITPQDLAGLSCEEFALSRIVQHELKRDQWSVRNGPFNEADFAKLSKKHWTLLVQDVDKWDMDVASLRDRFDFVPSWRVDDVMVSYAVDGGGVGAHVDQYDVFLIQGRGQRRWRISTDPRASKEFRADVELKLLRDFTPTHEWILESGDALYLPPGIAHEGVGIGECMTFSVGMRAPSKADLLLDFTDFLAESLNEEQRYSDADLALLKDANEIGDDALARVRAAMPHISNVDKSTFATWFGSFITRYRAVHDATSIARPVTAAQLKTKMRNAVVLRNPWSRFAWTRNRRNAELFVAGQSYVCSIALAQLLAATREISGKDLLDFPDDSAISIAVDLINAGHWQLAKAR